MRLRDDELEQLSYERDLRDSGMALAIEHSESWMDRGWRILTMLADSRIPFTVDDLRKRAGAPPVANALGGLFRQARAKGLIEPRGHRQSTRPGRHAGEVRLWVGV